jgi:hypothetical protein
MTIPTDTAPRLTVTPKSPPTGDPGKKTLTKLGKSLKETYETVGGMVLLFDMQCGTAVIENAENMARSLDTLAQNNPKVKEVLLKLTEASGWGQVLVAHAPVLLAVYAHHGGQVQSLFTGNKPEPTPEYTQPPREHPPNNAERSNGYYGD